MGQTKLLENFIRTLVEEAMMEMAVKPEEAEARGLALSIFNLNSYVYFVLFKPGDYLEFCQNVSKRMQEEQEEIGWAVSNLLEEVPNPVVGYIRIKKDDCGWVVQNSAATHSYGPLMYDIAMSYAGKTGLMPDRIEGVSNSARNIWKYYATQRQGEIRMYPLKSDDECATFSNETDTWFLDARYVLRNGNINNLNALTAKAEQVKTQVDKDLDAENILRRLASNFFDLKYFR